MLMRDVDVRDAQRTNQNVRRRFLRRTTDLFRSAERLSDAFRHCRSTCRRSFAIDTHASRSFAYLVIEHVVDLHDLSIYVFDHQSFLLRKFFSFSRVDRDEIFRSSPWPSSQRAGDYTSTRKITRRSSPIDGSRHLWCCSFAVRRFSEKSPAERMFLSFFSESGDCARNSRMSGRLVRKEDFTFSRKSTWTGRKLRVKSVVSVHLHHGSALRCFTRRRRLRHRFQRTRRNSSPFRFVSTLFVRSFVAERDHCSR